MLAARLRDSKNQLDNDEILEKKIYHFSPVFPKKSTYADYVKYYNHRQRLLEVGPTIDTTPPKSMMNRRQQGPQLSIESNQLRLMEMQNQLLLARIAKRMLEPSQVDNHMQWDRTTRAPDKWRMDMLNATYRNIWLMKLTKEVTSDYDRAKLLNEWTRAQRVMSHMSQYCHDWRDPYFTPMALCHKFRRAKSATIYRGDRPTSGGCRCHDGWTNGGSAGRPRPQTAPSRVVSTDEPVPCFDC